MKLHRRNFLTSTMAVSALSPALARRKRVSSRPNILVILVDQMNLDAISAYRKVLTDKAYNCHWLETPNLDRMVAESTSFIESHSTDPVCCPARASLWTGRMSCEHGVFYNNIGIDKSVPNLAQWLGQHTDYRRIYCGKWHAGGAWNCPEISGNRKIPGFETLPTNSHGNGKVLDYQISTATEAFLHNYNEEEPFLIVAGLLNPHDCCFWTPPHSRGCITSGTDYFELGKSLPELPPNQDVDYSDAGIVAPGIPASQWSDMHWKNYIYDYLRQVETLDKDVGRMLKAAQAREDDTIVVFTSDHGDGGGRHRRVQKWHPYESSVKVPFIISGRDIQAGQIDQEHLISHIDLVPTLCDYIGIAPPPKVRGISLRPLLEGREPKEWRDEVYYSFRSIGRAIRSERYKYVMSYKPSGQISRKPNDGVVDKPFIDQATGEPSRFEPGQGDRFEKEPNELLFDMQADAWETRNLAQNPEYTAVLNQHRARLKNWEATLEIGNRFDRN